MALYLVQHGKSLSKEQDPEKGLSEQGLRDVEGISEVARSYGVKVARIQHSGKKRARQTAELFASALAPEQGVQERNGLNPLDDVANVAGALSSEESLMIVGHLPFMEKLVSYLITGSDDKTVFKFQNGGIICLDYDPDERSWFIKWALMPHID